MRVTDYADAFLPLEVGNLLMEPFHFRPVHLRTEVMFGVVSVIEKEPVVELAVAAMPHAIGLLGFAP